MGKIPSIICLQIYISYSGILIKMAARDNIVWKWKLIKIAWNKSIQIIASFNHLAKQPALLLIEWRPISKHFKSFLYPTPPWIIEYCKINLKNIFCDTNVFKNKSKSKKKKSCRKINHIMFNNHALNTYYGLFNIWVWVSWIIDYILHA